MWSLVVGGIAYLISRNVCLGGVLGPVVFGRWVLDRIVHPADLPLLPGDSPKVGLGLWCSGPGPIASIVLELGLFAGGIAVYVLYRGRSAREGQGV